MNLKILKSKKILAIISIILVFIVIGILVYFNYTNQIQELSTQPANMNEIILELEAEYIDINELENEVEQPQANTIDEATENNIKTNENTNKNKTTNTNNNTNIAPYYIKVNYGAQVVTIYKKDENGNYTVPVKAMVCSTGVATPKSGVYSIPARWEWLRLQGNVYGHYSTQITGNILFHSVPYLEKGNPASLEYWEYDKLGTYASAGCVRLTVIDAKWIYDNCARGTKVEFYSDSNSGPLGKPSFKKISSYPDNLRNWDPTDPNNNNPWKTYQENTTQTNNDKTNTIVENDNTNNSSNVVDNTIINDNNVVENTITSNNNTVDNITTDNNNTVVQNTITNSSNIQENTTTNNNESENITINGNNIMINNLINVQN